MRNFWPQFMRTLQGASKTTILETFLIPNICMSDFFHINLKDDS
jgi:hypothetical protein